MINFSYIIYFAAAAALSAFMTIIVRKAAFRFGVLDVPDKANVERKIHKKPIPLLGGVAIFISFFSLLFIFSEHFLSGALEMRHLIGFFIGALFLVIGGALDDKFDLKPSRQMIFPVLAIIAVIAGGVEIGKITNPFGGAINLSALLFVSPLLIAVWLLGMMYTTKLLDGVDGLVSGISVIGSFIIFLFTISTKYYQPDIAFAAIIFSGAVFGFLIFNWHPAKIFLGEGGSLLVGYVLGVLAIISGGKIAIALLIMGIPILDVAWTIIRRASQGKNPLRFSDRKHLHHRLLDLGLGQRQTVLIFCFVSFVFGFSGLFLQSRGKFFALALLFILMLIVVIFFRRLDKRKKKSLLLQVCCAPCAIYPSVEILQKKYELTWYFCNPNLFSEEEYESRLEAVRTAAEKFSIALIVEPYEHTAWQKEVLGWEDEPEKGKRCHICYRYRLEKTVALAKNKSFDFFGTSLTVSPYKDAVAIKSISEELAEKYGVSFLPDNLRNDEVFRHSQELAKSLGLYRQKFCGCEYSMNHLKKI